MATKITPDFSYSNSELLALVDEAIATVTKYGTSYTIGGRVFTREHLPELYELKNSLEAQVARLTTDLAFNNARLMRKP